MFSACQHATAPQGPNVDWAFNQNLTPIFEAKGFPVPAPNSGGVASGKFVARVPKTTHAQLATRAKAEGVSLNTLVLTFIAEGLGRREHHA